MSWIVTKETTSCSSFLLLLVVLSRSEGTAIILLGYSYGPTVAYRTYLLPVLCVPIEILGIIESHSLSCLFIRSLYFTVRSGISSQQVPGSLPDTGPDR